MSAEKTKLFYLYRCMKLKTISDYQNMMSVVKQLSIQDLEKLNNIISNEIS